MKREIRKNFREFIAIIVLAVLASVVAIYILHNQRLRFPVFQDTPKKLAFEFSTAQAVTPGQGQTVRVSGIRIGDIAKTELRNGRALVTVDIDPKYFDLIHTDATALLRPKTLLKDMFIELMPGTRDKPLVKEGNVIPVGNTLPDVNLDEFLASLDTDTRDYLKLLISDLGTGVRGRGGDLREVLKRLEPTHRDLARLNSALADRAENLRRLVRSLNLLNGALGANGAQLARLVKSSSDVFGAFASEQANVTRAVHDLPGALKQTTSTLGHVEQLGQVLRPAADHLRPALRSLTAANREVQPFAREAAPIVRRQVRPFVRASRPLARSLRPGARNLAASTPGLTRTFVVLNHLFNMLGYNENGREDPTVPTRDEGYLFWLAWLNHNAASVFSVSDANGPIRALTLGARCTILRQVADSTPPLGMLLAPSLLDPRVCGTG